MGTSCSSAESAEELILEVTDLSRGGSGVARAPNGQVLFIPLTAPGDRVRARILEREKRFAQAELLEILTPSANRVKPRCAVFGRCGGCEWQHLPYELQWKTKTEGLRHALKRCQAPEPKSWEFFPASNEWNYRNRIQLRGSSLSLGFYARKSHDIVPIERCEIALEKLNSTLPIIREQALKHHNTPYKVEAQLGSDGEVQLTWNKRHAAMGFRQVNDEQNEKMCAWVSSRIPHGRLVLDLFGGSGNFSSAASSNASRVHCIDQAAPETHPKGMPLNVEFHRSSVLSWLLKRQQSVPLLAILDPPRAGLSEALNELASALRRLDARELILVGCDPDSWARDLSHLTKKGWVLEEAAAFDLFPQTHHIEAIAFLNYSVDDRMDDPVVERTRSK